MSQSAGEIPTEQEAALAEQGKKKAKVNFPVFLGSSAGVLLIALWALISPDSAANVLGVAVGAISKWFGWFYIGLAAIILIFVFFLGFSRYGETRLGPPNSRPEFSTFSWASMLFAAGIGTDILFFSVAGPVSQYMHPPVGEGQTIEAAREATVWTLFHYGITGWGMYALMGMALGYFAYRRKKPLSVRSALYTIFGDKLNGPLGHIVDAAAILGTIFGVATTLGIGVVQLNVGLEILFGIKQGIGAQIGLVILAVVMATISATTGIHKGIRFLSQLNVILAMFLAGWVFFTGRTYFLLNAIVMNIGDFIWSFPRRSLETFAYSDVNAWMAAWTLFFWAWWVAWASFVGMFLARISRGRTLREFVVGTMLIPFSYVLMWVAIFGNAAIDMIRQGNTTIGEIALKTPEMGFYLLLDQCPAAVFIMGIATFVGLLFYVTSADSGALVMANLSSFLPTVRCDAPGWLRVFWAAVTGLLTIGMLLVGGIPALQNATIIMGLPFSVVMILVMIGLAKALKQDRRARQLRAHSARNILAGTGSIAGRLETNWRDRLNRTFGQVTPLEAQAYLDRVAEPALRDFATELNKQGIPAKVIRKDDDPLEQVDTQTRIYDRVKLTAFSGPDQFVYRILAVDTPGTIYAGSSLDTSRSTRLEVHLPDNDQDYDVMGYSRSAIIQDAFDHFDRYQDYWRINDA